MSARRPPGERLVALAVLGALGLNPPLLSLFDRAHAVLGVPLLFLYLFAAWALLIALTALAVERGTAPSTPEPGARHPDGD